MAIPELSGFPRRGVQGAYNRQNKGDPGGREMESLPENNAGATSYNNFQNYCRMSQRYTYARFSRFRCL